MKNILITSMDQGIKKPAIRWVMLAAPFSSGVGFYVFYASQPYLLNLYGNQYAYGIAGLTAAIVAGAQVIGGIAAVHIGKLFKKRTTVFLSSIILNTLFLVGIGLTHNFMFALLLLIVWGLTSAAVTPVRSAYLNGLIASSERATVLSFDSLLGSSGGVFIQPVLGKVADVWSYGASYIVGGAFSLMSLPFILLARREKPSSDHIKK